MVFEGELQLTNDPESRLAVSLTLKGNHLALRTGDESLGSWERGETRAVVRSKGGYDLTLGGETLIFTPTDQDRFASGFLPLLAEPSDDSAGFLAKMKTKLSTRPEAASTDVAVQPLRSEHPPQDGPGPLESAQSTPSIEAVEPMPTARAIELEPPPSVLISRAGGAEPDWAPSRERVTSAGPEKTTEDVEHLPSQSHPLPDLANLLARLDSAFDDLQAGRMEPDRGRAIAEVVRAMCHAVEVSGHHAKGLSEMADKIELDGLGHDPHEDYV